MDKRLCIFVCDSLVPEIEQCIQTGQFTDVEVKRYPAICVGRKANSNKIAEITDPWNSQFSKMVFIASSCVFKTPIDSSPNGNIEFVRLEQCFELFLGKETIYHLIKQGYYLVSNGWLRNYKHHISEWGFEPVMAKTFFGESMKKILLLDTGLPGEYLTNLQLLSEYMGLPYEILPIGLSYCSNYLNTIISSWRAETERVMLNDRLVMITSDMADYLIIFNQLKILVNYTDENIIIKEISGLADILFAPQNICYFQQKDGSEIKLTCQKSQSEIVSFNPDNSFSIEIEHHGDILGRFEIVGVKFPDYLPRYVKMGKVICQMAGLSVANARKYAELENAKFELALSEDRFKSMFEQAPMGIALIDSLNGKIQNANSKFADIAGRTRDEMPTIDWMSITHPDDVQEDIDNLNRMNSGEIPGFYTNKRYIRPNGEIVWISMSIAPVQVADNNYPLHLCMIEDITERMRLEDEIHRSEKQFKNLSQSATEMINLPTLDAIYDYITTTLHQQYPHSVILFQTVDENESTTTLRNIKGISKTLLAKTFKLVGFNFFKNKYKLIPLHTKIFKSGKFVNFPGGLVQFSAKQFPSFAAKATEKLLGINKIYTIGINKDEKLYATIHFFTRKKTTMTENEYIESFVKQAGIVIERKLLELSLKESEERYRLIAENTSDVIWTLNIETLKFSYISPSVTQLTGFTVEEAMAQSIPEVLEPKSAEFVLTELPKRIAAYYNGNFIKMTSTNELQQICKDGSLIWVEFTTMFNINNEGKITDILGVSRNIDERKNFELEIQDKNKELVQINAEKDKLFSLIAHDLRNPFSSISGLTDVIISESEDITPAQLREYADSMKKTTLASYNLLENLLDWSRLQRGLFETEPVSISFHKLVEDAKFQFEEIALKKNIQITNKVSEGFIVAVDERMIGSVIRNLLSNAIKFTSRGGAITVEAIKSDNTTIVKICDNGIGMNSDILSKIFHIGSEKGKLGTEGERSSGLGLLLCKEFVEKHGGDIWAESIEGNGSTFYFTLKE